MLYDIEMLEAVIEQQESSDHLGLYISNCGKRQKKIQILIGKILPTESVSNVRS